jgi:hypothetical protein
MGLIAEIAYSVGIGVRHSCQTELVAAAELVRFLEAVRARDLRVLGLEGFRIVGSSLVPDMDAIADFSSIGGSATNAETVDEALLFISNVGEPDLFFEVTFGEESAKPCWGLAARGVTRSLDDVGSLRGASAKEIEDLIPKDFVKSQVRKGDGFCYADPARRGDQIRIMRGDPGATDPLHQGPYAVISRSDNVTRIPLEGNPTLP